jgi:general nucleoside transport system ATP-binding protein
MRGIVKRFGPAVALNGVTFDVRAGEIHALLGENGAGKSTLMHILSGLMSPNAGEILLNGKPVGLPSPRVAREAGIAMVHQHFTLVPAFTVEENLALDDAHAGRAFGYRAADAAAKALQRADSLGWKLEARARVSELPVGAQQRVEIVKALATEARLLIFDEPTAVLSGDEVEELFVVLRRLRDEGHAVILIAHKLAEIMAIADRVTVLRRGRNVVATRVADTSVSQLAAWMVGEPDIRHKIQDTGENEEVARGKGRESNTHQSKIQNPKSAMASFFADGLIVRGDRGEMAVRELSLQVGSGEIVGIGGVDGNGQAELAEALVGLRTVEAGTLTWQGNPLVPGSHPRTGYIPQDRRRAGLATSLSVEENLLFEAVRFAEYRRGPFLQRRKLAHLATSLMGQYDIRAANVRVPVSSLSGGNQQKIVVARALHSHPGWIVAVNPTRGLDIGATRFVHAQIRQARERGAAIVLISTDLDELAALADRQAVLSGGKLAEYTKGNGDAAQIGLLLGGVTGQE